VNMQTLKGKGGGKKETAREKGDKGVGLFDKRRRTRSPKIKIAETKKRARRKERWTESRKRRKGISEEKREKKKKGMGPKAQDQRRSKLVAPPFRSRPR